MLRVAVIGAGAAGLCMARYLAARPNIFKAVVYEQTSCVGGTWVYTDKTGLDENGLPVHSSMYKNLRTNLPKQVMAFPDFPFPEDMSTYMEHSDVSKYLLDYMEHFSLKELIHFNHQVLNVTPKFHENKKEQWEVTVKDLKSNNRTTSTFDAIVVCNGHYSEPKVPTLPGQEKFPGHVMHSHQYRHPEDFAGKNIVVIGSGSSGVDIGLELCDQARNVYLSHHGDRFTCSLPDNLEQHQDVKQIENDGMVVFEDDQKRKADVIMFCTGYLFSFPFLSDGCQITVNDNRITHLYKHLFNIKYPSMSFIGLPIRICPFPQFSLQAQFITAVLTGTSVLPPETEMLQDEERDFQEKMSSGLKHHYAHKLGPEQWDYNDKIAQMAKCDPLNPIVKNLYQYAWKYRVSDLMNYKNKEFVSTSDSTFEMVK